MKISIITASYNYAQYLCETIESVLNQTYQDWELIVVDDGSSDNSVEIIKTYCEKDSRIKFLQHDNAQNRGLKETLLLGLKNATGEWVAFLESDDVFEPDNLLKKVEIAEKYPDVKLIFNHVKYLYEGKKSKRRMKSFVDNHKKLSKQKFPRNMLFDFYVDNMILTFSCVMVKADTIKSADFNTPNDARLDWWLWINLAYGNDFYYINKSLTGWRQHPESYINQSKVPKWYFIQMKAYDNVYKKHPDDLKLLYFNSCYKIKVYFIRGFRFIKNLPGRIFDKISRNIP